MNDRSGSVQAEDRLDRSIRELVGRAGSDAPTEPVTLTLAPEHPSRARPRWLAAAAVLLAFVALASVVALRRDRGDDPAVSSVPVLQTTAPISAVRPPSLTSAPGKAATPTTAVAGPVEQDYGPIKCGDGIGKITIPSIDVNFYYVACVGKDELNRGVGHFPKSVVPGQLGNAALAGHRTSHQAPFEELDELEPGDVIRIETILGGAFSYTVTGSEVVDPSDYHVVTDSDPTKATLTLITCTPKFTSKERLVIHADLDPSASGSVVGVGQTYYGEANPDPSAANDRLPDVDR